jgi:hypothetical protein
MGQRHRPSMATTPRRIPLTANPTVHPTRGTPTGPEEARTPSDTGRPVIPTCNNQATQPANTGFNPTESDRTKNRG